MCDGSWKGRTKKKKHTVHSERNTNDKSIYITKWTSGKVYKPKIEALGARNYIFWTISQ